MSARRGRHRVQGWERILARVSVFGFDVFDKGSDTIEVSRNGRKCTIDLVNAVRIGGEDPRDLWVLKRAVEDGSQWEIVETYFFRRSGDGVIMPVELRLGRHSGEERTPFLDHDELDGDLERTTLRDFDTLLDALPPLAAPNTIGYHYARERIFAKYDEVRRKTWVDIGINDSALIAEFENFYVSADHVAHARANGYQSKGDIITKYGRPAFTWDDDSGNDDIPF